MKQIARRFLFSRYFLIPAGLLLLYTLLGFLAAPFALRWYLPRFSQAHFNSHAEIGEVRINPFLLTVEARQFGLKGLDGELLAEFGRLFFRVEAGGLFQKTVRFGELTLENPGIHLVIGRDGVLNFARLVPSSPEETVRDAPQSKPSDPLRMVLENFTLTSGRITVTDQRQSTPATMAISDISLDLKSLSTIRNLNGQYCLSASTSEGGSVQWQGEISLLPFQSKGTLACAGIQAKTAWEFLRDTLNLDAPTGTLTLSTDYSIDSSYPALQLSLEHLWIDLAELSLKLAGTEEPFLELNQFALDSAKFDLASRNMAVGKILLDGGKIRLRIDESGRTNLARIVRVSEPAQKEQAKPPAASEGLPGASENTPTTPEQKPSAAEKAPTPAEGAPAAAEKVPSAAEGGSAAPEKTPAASEKAPVAGEKAPTVPEQKPSAAEKAPTPAEGAPATAGGASPVQAETGGWTVDVDQLEISNIGIGFEDTRHESPMSAGIAGISLKSKAGIETGRNLKARIGEFQLELADLLLESKRASAPLSGHISNISIKTNADVEMGDGLSVRLDEILTDLTGLRLESKQAAGPLSTEISGVSIKAKARIEAEKSLKAQLAEARAELSGLRLGNKQAAGPVFEAQGLILDGCEFDLAERNATVSLIRLNDARLDAGLDKDGKLDLASMFGGGETGAGTKDANETRLGPKNDWKLLVKAFELNNFRSALSDLGISQKPLYNIKGLNAKVSGIDGKSAMPVEMTLGVEQGGKLAFQGKVDPSAPSVELKASVSDLVLTPLAPYLAPYITLTLQSAAISTEGTFRYGIPKSGSKLAYEGKLSLDKLNLTQPGSKETYLGWGAMRLSKLKMAMEPNSLHVEEVTLSKPLGELIIAQDGTVNLSKIVKEQPAEKPRATASRPSPAQGGKQAAQARPQPAKSDDSFPFKINTVRIEEGNIVYADLSLFPKFMTRIHDLKGTITNLSSERGVLSKIHLAGGVDRYGSAKAEGTLDLSDYKRSTELNVIFRNVEMANMTPYSGKFAGRKIKSGKLSTDLKYVIKENKLTGDNKIIVDNLVLGERVESPHATNLPLDLAVALLSDSNGRIDLGLPVSGDLDDPQFSIGPLIWKAITALVVKTATAPFRALAGIFGGGGGDRKFDSIEFDPGKAELPPPEKEKLKKVADGLKVKTHLMVVVHGHFSPEVDGAELKELNLRRVIAEKVGIQIPPGVDPAPLDFGDSKVRNALEKLFTERSGEKALDEVKQAVDKGEITPRESSAEAAERRKGKKRGFFSRAASAVKVYKIVPGMRSPEKSEILAGELYFRLIDTEPLPEKDLLRLASDRGQVISNELRGAGRLQDNRVQASAPEPLPGEEGVCAKLSLEPQSSPVNEPPAN